MTEIKSTFTVRTTITNPATIANVKNICGVLPPFSHALASFVTDVESDNGQMVFHIYNGWRCRGKDVDLFIRSIRNTLKRVLTQVPVGEPTYLPWTAGCRRVTNDGTTVAFRWASGDEVTFTTTVSDLTTAIKDLENADVISID